jgi:hypothetical protein
MRCWCMARAGGDITATNTKFGKLATFTKNRLSLFFVLIVSFVDIAMDAVTLISLSLRDTRHL